VVKKLQFHGKWKYFLKSLAVLSLLLQIYSPLSAEEIAADSHPLFSAENVQANTAPPRISNVRINLSLPHKGLRHRWKPVCFSRHNICCRNQ
jgi:hypothetical protein